MTWTMESRKSLWNPMSMECFWGIPSKIQKNVWVTYEQFPGIRGELQWCFGWFCIDFLIVVGRFSGRAFSQKSLKIPLRKSFKALNCHNSEPCRFPDMSVRPKGHFLRRIPISTPKWRISSSRGENIGKATPMFLKSFKKKHYILVKKPLASV